jgi:hypothetical protein
MRDDRELLHSTIDDEAAKTADAIVAAWRATQ